MHIHNPEGGQERDLGHEILISPSVPDRKFLSRKVEEHFVEWNDEYQGLSILEHVWKKR